MSFLIEYNFREQKESALKHRNPVQLNSRCAFVDLGKLKGQKISEKKSTDGSVIYFGDLISAPFCRSMNEFTGWLHSSKGNFNGIYYSEKSVLVFGSMFNVLPLFYTNNGSKLVISDQIKNLIPYLNQNNVDDTHFLERILFNYSLTNRTCISGIRQLPVNSYLRLEENKFEIEKHTEISDLFQSSPILFNKCLDNLTDLFNERLTEYLPDQLFNVALTGGFDGRCIVSACINKEKEYIAYSFGTKESGDVKIPLAISKKTGINYQPVIINDNYLSDHYYESARRMIIESNGLATIGRAHYTYGSEILSRRADVLVSGVCGSELLRAAHLDGVLTTPVFFYWLKDGLPGTLSGFLKLFPNYDFLDYGRFSAVYEGLVIELEEKRSKNANLPLNARLYYLMWEESLRNYFGGELSMQQNYLIHRSPFTDYTFYKEIQKTKASGAYFNFRSRNLVKRMSGQFFYADFLKKNSEELFRAPTSRGYSPSDILSVKGNIKLLYSKFMKKSKVSDFDNDTFYAKRGFLTYSEEFMKNMDKRLENYVNIRKKIDEMSMKSLITFSIFFDYLDKEAGGLNKNLKP